MTYNSYFTDHEGKTTNDVEYTYSVDLNNKFHGEFIMFYKKVYVGDKKQRIYKRGYYKHGKKSGLWVGYSFNGEITVSRLYSENKIINEKWTDVPYVNSIQQSFIDDLNKELTKEELTKEIDKQILEETLNLKADDTK